MQATQKSEGLENFLTNLTGADRRQTIANSVCIPAPYGCGKEVQDFRDAMSRKEYTISGLCQECQDLVFEETEETNV